MLSQTPLPVFLLSCWWLISPSVAYPPVNPGLSARGLLSSNHYFVKQATDAITILTLNGTSRVDHKTPGRYIFQPNLSWRSEQHLYYLTNTNWEDNPNNHGLVLGPYSLICADLVSGVTRVVANLDTGPSIYYLVVETEGIDFVSRFDDISLWSSGKGYPLEEKTAGQKWDLQFDKEYGKIRWLSSTDHLSSYSDMLAPTRSFWVNEYDVASGETNAMEIRRPPLGRKFFHPQVYGMVGTDLLVLTEVFGYRWIGYDFSHWVEDQFHLSQPTRYGPAHDTWLIVYNTRTGTVKRTHAFKNQSYKYGRNPWIIIENSLFENDVYLYNWKTKGRMLLPHEDIHGFETNMTDDPVVLTEKHVFIYDKDSMQIKERYNTPLKID